MNPLREHYNKKHMTKMITCEKKALTSLMKDIHWNDKFSFSPFVNFSVAY